MQSKAMFESLRIVCKLNIQRVIDGRARQLAKERTGGSAACTTAGGIAACERLAVRHARNGPSGMQAEANAEIRCKLNFLQIGATSSAPYELMNENLTEC